MPNCNKYYIPGIIKHSNLMALLNGYKRPNDKISYMIEKGELIKIKKGMYVFSEYYKSGDFSFFNLANALYGPSYVSMYSALAYYGAIPEEVYTVDSITIKRSKKFKTPIGTFHYHKSDKKFFNYGIDSIKTKDGISFLIASPTKALCELIWFTKGLDIGNIKELEDFLFDDIRLDYDFLEKLSMEELKIYTGFGKKIRILNNLQRLIKVTKKYRNATVEEMA